MRKDDLQKLYLLTHFLRLQGERLGLSRVIDRCTRLSETLKEEIQKEKQRERFIRTVRELENFYNERRAKK